MDRRLRRAAGVAAVAIAAVAAGGASRAAAQQTLPGDGRVVFVNADAERYLRLMQDRGVAALHPWSVRSFSRAEVGSMLRADTVAHPWAWRWAAARDDTARRGVALLPAEAGVIANSGFAYGLNDGAVWAGRGVTTVVQAGAAAHYGPLSLVIAPIAFHTTNAAFDLMPNGRTGRLAYADPLRPGGIDLPQRFGDAPYSRVDPGQSTLRLDLAPLALGVSTANQHWGPARDHPVLLGNNAGGFPHLFLGTSAPVDLWIAKVHGRAVWGRLDQSEYSAVTGTASRRFMSGVVGVVEPRGLPGLELGAARFFHSPWPPDGLDAGDFLKPFEGLLKAGLATDDNPSGDDAANQLASLFARWVFPASGVEVYGEYGREDHSHDLRDVILEPDHIAATLVGLQKVWAPTPERWVVLRGEVLNTRIGNLARVRPQSSWYTHSVARQGHTQRGQLLGSAAGYAGGAATLGVDLYHPGGRWSVAWSRLQQRDRVLATPAMQDARGVDAVHTLGAEALFFRGRYELGAGVTGVYEIDRHFERDAFNLNANLVLRARW